MYRSAKNSSMYSRISPKLIPAISGPQQLDIRATRTSSRWEPEIAGIKSRLILAYILQFLAPCHIIYITRTGFSMRFQWYHSLEIQKTSWEDIRVFLPKSCYQSGHFRSIEPILHPKPTTPYIEYTDRTGFLMPFRWCPPYCDKSIAWERASASCCCSPINGYHIQVKH